MPPQKYCFFAKCNSDARKHPWLKFAAMPNPRKERERAEIWLKKSCRSDLTLNTITLNSYVCEKHFAESTEDFLWTNRKLEPFSAYTTNNAGSSSDYEFRNANKVNNTRPTFKRLLLNQRELK
jgi:hypothetical protein